MFDALKDKAIGFGSKIMFKVSENSPELLIVAGAITGIAACVLACRSTLRVEAVLEEHNENMKVIDETFETLKGKEEESVEGEKIYSLADKRHDTVVTYSKTAWKMLRLYAPSVVLGAISLACFIGSHNIQARRIAGLTTAYSALDEAFKAYRGRVVEEEGEEKDKHYRFGTKAEKIQVPASFEDGETQLVDKEYESVGNDILAKSIVFSEETCDDYTGIDYNDQKYLNDKQNLLSFELRRKGHLLLNEALDILNIKVPLEVKLSNSRLGWVLKTGEEKVLLNAKKFDVPDYRHLGCFRTIYILEPNYGIIQCKAG